MLCFTPYRSISSVTRPTISLRNDLASSKSNIPVMPLEVKFAVRACVVSFPIRQIFAHGVSNFGIFPRVMWHFLRDFCIGSPFPVYVFLAKSLHRENRSYFQRPASNFTWPAVTWRSFRHSRINIS